MNFEFSGFDTILNSVLTMLDTFSGVVDRLLMTPNDLLDLIGINVNLPGWIGDVSPMEVMIGLGLPFYLAYTFITWVLDVTP